MDHNKYMTTGEFARRMGVTKNTLFHYDNIGLFLPEIVDTNDYRYYSIYQMEVFDTIIILKEMGMPLNEIKEFMDHRSPESLMELFEKEDKKELQEALKNYPSVDLALFGRMVADDPSLNYDAAAQVAHSISTHAVQNEYDYFTAVDDCQAEDNAGAGHLGTVEYNSSTLYRYATVNVMELARQLGAAQAAETVRAFGEAFFVLHAHRQTEQLCKPHSAGCSVCDHPGRSAGEPVRRIRAGCASQCAGLRRAFQGGTGTVRAADVQQLCRGPGPELYRGQRSGGTGSGADGKGYAGRTGKECPGRACRK